MNTERINDYVDIWAQSVGLSDRNAIQIIKNDIIKRCMMYGRSFPTISIEQDKCKAYIIKPINGKYKLEDFFLNRLMLGIRDIDFSGSMEGNAGEYIAHYKSLSVDVSKLYSIINDKAQRHPGLRGKADKIVIKTIEHELGHCFKSSFTDGYLAGIGLGREQDAKYKKLIDNISLFENGKYADEIISKDDLISEHSDKVKTGVSDSNEMYGYDYRMGLIDELLNETEALELTQSNDVQEIWPLQDKNGKDSSSGNYVNVYNYVSGYSPFTAYGPIFKSLLGRKNKTFYAEYLSSKDIFKKFDDDFGDIFEEMYQTNSQEHRPIWLLSVLFNKLARNYFDEEVTLELDELFAKCYERKVNKYIEKKEDNLSIKGCKSILSEISFFKTRMTTNIDSAKRDKLPHVIIFNEIENRINKIIQDIQHSESTNNISTNKIEDAESLQTNSDIENTELEFDSETNIMVEYEEEKRKILRAKHFTEEQKQLLINELDEEYSNIVEENTNSHGSR